MFPTPMLISFSSTKKKKKKIEGERAVQTTLWHGIIGDHLIVNLLAVFYVLHPSQTLALSLIGSVT